MVKGTSICGSDGTFSPLSVVLPKKSAPKDEKFPKKM